MAGKLSLGSISSWAALVLGVLALYIAKSGYLSAYTSTTNLIPVTGVVQNMDNVIVHFSFSPEVAFQTREGKQIKTTVKGRWGWKGGYTQPDGTIALLYDPADSNQVYTASAFRMPT